MKKLLILSLAILNISLYGCKEKKTTAAAVPEAVINAFNARYPGLTDVKWEEETDKDKTLFDAEFKMDNKKKEARFDDMGNFIDEK